MKAAVLFFSLIMIFGCQERLENTGLLNEITQLGIENDSLTKAFIDTNVNFWFDNDYEGRFLLENGIENPALFIEESFLNKPDLIPLSGVLGGKMTVDRVQILSDKWIIANYSDGHIDGRAIYEFEMNDKKQLFFTLLKSTRL